MKKLILILFLISVKTVIYSQNIIKKTTIQIDDAIRQIMSTRIAVVKYQIVEIDLSHIKVEDSFILDFFNNHLTLKKDRIEERGINEYTLFLTDYSKLNQAIITIKKNDVQGLLTVNNEIYRIETLFDKILITQIDQSKYPNEKCNYSEDLKNLGDSIPKSTKSNNIEQQTDDINFKTYPEQDFINYQCKLRVLALYTLAAKKAKNSIENHIQLAIDEMNQSFVNSGVNFQVELVFAGETNYKENNWLNDLRDFQNNGDGNMDIVHSLREKYSADVCVLVMNDATLCGVARGIKTCPSHSFCTVYWDCATGYFSFSHEIGHLIGARHDPHVDSENSPYAYGHGFVDPKDGWRTIMAYGTDCNQCTRIQWWSNPNLSRNGQAMGTVQTHDNTRLLNTYIPNIMSHRPSSGIRTVTQVDINSALGVIYHSNKIENAGSVVIPKGYSWGFIAGNEVNLNPGFEAETGSNFEAKLQTPCGKSDGEGCNFNINFDVTNLSTVKNDYFFEIYPNPTSNSYIFVKKVNNKTTAKFKIYITNVIGKKLQIIEWVDSNNEIVLTELSPGLYFVNIFSEDSLLETHKLIIE